RESTFCRRCSSVRLRRRRKTSRPPAKKRRTKLPLKLPRRLTRAKRNRPKSQPARNRPLLHVGGGLFRASLFAMPFSHRNGCRAAPVLVLGRARPRGVSQHG